MPPASPAAIPGLASHRGAPASTKGFRNRLDQKRCIHPASPRALPNDVPIVYFGNDWFAENRTSSHHIARLLGQRFPVLYVETPGLRAPSASDATSKRSGGTSARPSSRRSAW